MRRGTALVLALVVALPLAAAPVTLARFSASRASTATFGTATLAAPTSLTGVGGTSATLTWVPSTSTSATGYYLMRSGTSGSGYTQVKTVTPVTTATTTDAPANGTWYYVLQTYLQGWTSGVSNEASVLVGASTSTGYKGCASGSNAAETTGSGDDNGYQTRPGNACALDGAVATDKNSGSDTTTACNSAGKDRHRFWGYTLGLPASVTSINGITVRLAADVDSLTGSPLVCVELSWDSGGHWTPAQTVSLTSTGITTYTLGGPTDLWGHTPWTVGQLGTSTFRIRVTDVAASTSRDFGLDYLGVQVNYTP